jgi:protein SDA1
MIEDANVTAAKKSLHVLMTLYKKRVWTDARTINVIANACLLKEPKLVNIACTFLLRADQNELYSDSSSEGEEEPDKVIVGAKKTKGRIHQKEREANQFKKKQRRKEKKAQSKEPSFLTIDQLNDAQGFVEKMLFNLKKVFNKGKHELQCIMLQVIARVVGRHRLMLIELYSFLQKFVTPKSKKVTQMLIICAEATHELVPPNEIAPVIRKILDNFLSEHCSEAFIVLGLNCMREICKRQPRVMTKDLLDHISTFKNYKNKSVVIACSGLVNLFKEIRPSLLRNKLRPGEEDLVGEYGEVKVHSRVPGAELLEAAEEEKRLSNQSVVIRQPQQKSDNLMRLENTLSRREEIVKNQISQSKVVKKIRKVKEVESDEEISQSDDEESEDIQEEQGCEMEGSGDSDQDEDLIEGSEDEDEIDEDQSNEEEDEEEDEEDEDEEDEDEEEDEEEHKNEEAEGSSDEVSEKDHQDDNLIQEPEDKPIYYRSTTEGIPYECDKILSQNDFNRIKQLQREAEAKRRRMDVDLLNSSDDESNEFVGEDDLETMQVSKQAKIQQSIIDKKEHKRHKKDKKGGKTNKQHAKSKPLMMVMSKKKKSIKRQFEAVKKKIRRSKQQLGKFSKRFNATKRQLK